jgi:hypothetical protein
MRVLAMFLSGVALIAQAGAQDGAMNPGHIRLGHQEPVYREQFMTGILVDGSCDDRSALNLRQKPQMAPAPLPSQATGGVSAKGVTVDAQTLARERSDALAHQVPDLRMRQPDLTCAITGGTKSYALLRDDGQLLNLDEGGNTLAAQFLQSSPEGRALLNGSGPALKPRVIIHGRLEKSKLIVQRIENPGRT